MKKNIIKEWTEEEFVKPKTIGEWAEMYFSEHYTFNNLQRLINCDPPKVLTDLAFKRLGEFGKFLESVRQVGLIRKSK